MADSIKGIAVLRPSTQLFYHRKDNLAQTLQVDTGSVQAWRKGKLQFQGESFADIASALENWYGVKIIFSDATMRSCRYYMSFDNTLPLEKLLPTMAETVDTKYVFDESEGTITLSGKGCQ